MKILITGGKGYLARNLKILFETRGYNVLSPSHDELDISNSFLLQNYLKENFPDSIIHCASKGGKRWNKPDTHEDYISNIIMFENLMRFSLKIPIIIYGSGAEFDRRRSIDKIQEDQIIKSWPLDAYGLSKNIISRRVLDEYKNRPIYILRLFGCFNHDEDNHRFIKNSNINLKRGTPIDIYQNKEMDFFFLDDVFTVTEYFILHGPDKSENINLVYEEKKTLLDIANMICKHALVSNPKINVQTPGMAPAYTGCGNKLKNKNLNLIGLEEGIRRTCLIKSNME